MLTGGGLICVVFPALMFLIKLRVIRTSDGEVRWMEIRDYLKRVSDNGKKAVRQIVFAGERFDVISVRRWRDQALDLNQLWLRIGRTNDIGRAKCHWPLSCDAS